MNLTKHKFFLPALVLLTLVLAETAAIALNARTEPEVPAGAFEISQTVTSTVPAPSTPHGEMRALWVPYMHLNMSGHPGAEAFRAHFDEILKKAKQCKFNTLIVHVRPFCDAFYPSKIFPWSHLLTGTQGKDPGFDPLKYMLQAGHDQGFQVHAWVNPFRVGPETLPLAENNPAAKLGRENVENLLHVDGKLFLNPAIPYSRRLIIEGVEELLGLYPELDGIHIDDYFYPENCDENDAKSYEAYIKRAGDGPFLFLEAWRKANVNALVAGLYSAVKKSGEKFIFGISTSAISRLNNIIGADVETWARTPGYCDYICPQIYFSLSHPIAPFECIAKEWKEFPRHKDLRLYCGLALYKAGTCEDADTWQNTDDILAKELKIARELGYDGFMVFSSCDLFRESAKPELENLLAITN